MARQFTEFYCNDCDGWILLNLNTNLSGDFMVQCPNCGRKHPRTFENKGGNIEFRQDTTEYKIRGDRKLVAIRNFKEGDGKLEVIIPMKSAYSKKSRIDKALQSVSKIQAQAWKDRVANEEVGDNLDFAVKDKLRLVK